MAKFLMISNADGVTICISKDPENYEQFLRHEFAYLQPVRDGQTDVRVLLGITVGRMRIGNTMISAVGITSESYTNENVMEDLKTVARQLELNFGADLRTAVFTFRQLNQPFGPVLDEILRDSKKSAEERAGKAMKKQPSVCGTGGGCGTIDEETEDDENVQSTSGTRVGESKNASIRV